MYMHVCACMSDTLVFMYTSMCVYMRACMSMGIVFMYMWVCLCVFLHLCSVCVCGYMFICVHMCICIFWPCYEAWGILAPQPGMKHMPPEVEAQSPNHWTTREFPA